MCSDNCCWRKNVEYDALYLPVLWFSIINVQVNLGKTKKGFTMAKELYTYIQNNVSVLSV